MCKDKKVGISIYIGVTLITTSEPRVAGLEVRIYIALHNELLMS